MTDNRIARYEREPRTYVPRLDVADVETAYEFVFDVPGASSFDLEVDGGVLELRAEVPDRAPEGSRPRAVREYGIGAYHRRVELPVDVDVDALAGRYEHGVLTVTAPKSGRSSPRTIPVTTA